MKKKLIYKKKDSTEDVKAESKKVKRFRDVNDFLKANGINPDEVEVTL